MAIQHTTTKNVPTTQEHQEHNFCRKYQLVDPSSYTQPRWTTIKLVCYARTLVQLKRYGTGENFITFPAIHFVYDICNDIEDRSLAAISLINAETTILKQIVYVFQLLCTVFCVLTLAEKLQRSFLLRFQHYNQFKKNYFLVYPKFLLVTFCYVLYI